MELVRDRRGGKPFVTKTLRAAAGATAGRTAMVLRAEVEDLIHACLTAANSLANHELSHPSQPLLTSLLWKPFYASLDALGDDMAPFVKGRQKTGGRVKGARNRIAYKLIEALAKDFEEHGEEAIRIARIERPHEYLKIIVSTMPKEFEITDSRLQDISDDELELLIEHVRQQRGAIRSTDSREEQTIN